MDQFFFLFVFIFVIQLLQTMTYFRCLQPAENLPVTANIRSEFSDCQWQPMAANGTNGKITIGTIGKTPNIPTSICGCVWVGVGR